MERSYNDISTDGDRGRRRTSCRVRLYVYGIDPAAATDGIKADILMIGGDEDEICKKSSDFYRVFADCQHSRDHWENGRQRSNRLPFPPESPKQVAMTDELRSLHGFRDLYWGENLEEIIKRRQVDYLMDYTTPTGVDMTYYWVNFNSNESTTVYGVTTYTPQTKAIFIDGKLRGLFFFFEGTDANWSKLQDELIHLYGEPIEAPTNKAESSLYKTDAERSIGGTISMTSLLFWQGKDTFLSLGRGELKGTPFIMFEMFSKENIVYKAFSG